jgi:hypothetical protein
MQDFYIVAATIIPVLALTTSINLVVHAPGTPGTKEETEFDDLTRQIKRVLVAGMFFLGAFMIYGEWACLRSIETGHSAPGAPGVVWATLAYLGIGVVVMQTWAFATHDGDA